MVVLFSHLLYSPFLALLACDQREDGNAILLALLFSISGVLKDNLAIASRLSVASVHALDTTTDTLCQERPQRELAGVQRDYGCIIIPSLLLSIIGALRVLGSREQSRSIFMNVICCPTHWFQLLAG